MEPTHMHLLHLSHAIHITTISFRTNIIHNDGIAAGNEFMSKFPLMGGWDVFFLVHLNDVGSESSRRVHSTPGQSRVLQKIKTKLFMESLDKH
jgi:hypothetical protein